MSLKTFCMLWGFFNPLPLGRLGVFYLFTNKVGYCLEQYFCNDLGNVIFLFLCILYYSGNLIEVIISVYNTFIKLT